MLPTLTFLRGQTKLVLQCKQAQGYDVTGLMDELARMPASYDAYAEFGERLRGLRLRPDWRYVEPNGLDEIWSECDPERPLGPIGDIGADDVANRVKAAFEGAVAGCILGKPLEVDPTFDEIKAAAEAVGQWPIRDYISVALLDAFRRHSSWTETSRETIHYVAPDDDINYLIIGMNLIEKHGVNFTRQQLMEMWLNNLPITWAFGPERLMLLKAGVRSVASDDTSPPFDDWVETMNPKDEMCGAAIRVDAYGYACPGRPALAAELAWRDAGWTHRRTGIYASMFIAAAVAAAFVVKDRMTIFETALRFVPKKSRVYEVVENSMKIVKENHDWIEAYRAINAKYGEYRHCMLYQELATVINTVCHAESVGEGICMQVSQGCDTDCFAKIAGSILGAYFGPGHLESRWLAPFNGRILTTVAEFHEQSLSAVTARMMKLPTYTQDGA